MRPRDEHLTAQELTWFLAGSCETPESLAIAREHVGGCEACKAALDRALADFLPEPHQNFTARPAFTTLECPTPAAWSEYVAGGAEDNGSFLEHAAACEDCALLLKLLTQAEETWEDEEDATMNSEATNLNWQRHLALDLYHRVRPAKRWPGSWYQVAAAALVVLAVLGWWRWRMNRVETVYALLGEAYAARRTVELRIPGARYASLHVQRSRGNLEDQPEQLLRADLRIRDGLARNPGSPDWADAQARLDLLSWQYERADRELSRLVALHPGDAALLNDLALGLFERGEAENRPIDYGTAADYLGQALRLKPSYFEARFNRAIVYQRLDLFNEALQDWDEYLKLDPRGPWADEARRHQAECREKLGRRSSERDASPESALNSAITEWLPRISSRSDRSQALARKLLSQQGDAWLSDVISSGTSREVFEDLGFAVAANASGSYTRAEELATRASRGFAASHNVAGLLRAAWERAYAMQRTGRGRECLDVLGENTARLGTHPYTWLRIQFALQQSICASMTGDATTASASAERAIELARATGYHTLFLRSVGIRASMFTALGQIEEAWDLDQSGLRQYWQGSYPPMRSQQFLDDMMQGAEFTGRWYIAAALDREAIRASRTYPDHSFEAIERAKLAEYSTHSGDVSAARDQLEQAESLLQHLPQGRAPSYFTLYVETGLASAGGKAALEHLEQYGPLASELSNEVVASQYQRVRAQLLLDEQRLRESEQALGVALQSASRVRNSLLRARERLDWQREQLLSYRALVGIRMARTDFLGASHAWTEYLRGACDGPAPSASSMAENPEERVLTYVDVGPKFVIIASTPKALIVLYCPIAAPVLRRLARGFEAACASPASSPSEVRRIGSQLYAALLKPIEGNVYGARRLVFQMDGDLARVPLAAIPIGGGYLSDAYQIVSRPLLSCAVRPNPPTISGKVLAVASPVAGGRFQGFFPPLSDVGAEVVSVAQAFPATVKLEGPNATTAAVKRELSRATVFHFAGHSLRRASGSSLVLAASDTDDGIWQAARVNPATLSSCRLAVFSACSTAGADDSQDASGVDDLVRSFLSDGVQNVVASRWDVDSAATASFMREFYRALAGGQEVAEALRAAERLLKASPATAHPYYWAAFQAFGS